MRTMAGITQIPFTHLRNDDCDATYEKHVEFYGFDVGKLISKKKGD